MQQAASQGQPVQKQSDSARQISVFPSPEHAVIGCVLRGGWAAFDTAAQVITEMDFRTDDAALLWGYLSDLRVQNGTLDPIHLAAFLKDRGDGEAALRVAHEAYVSVSSGASVEGWARRLRVTKWLSELGGIAEIATSERSVNGDLGSVIEDVYDAAKSLYSQYADEVLTEGYVPGTAGGCNTMLAHAAGIPVTDLPNYLRLVCVPKQARNLFWSQQLGARIHASDASVRHWIVCPGIDPRYLRDCLKSAGVDDKRYCLSDVDPRSKTALRAFLRHLSSRLIAVPGKQTNPCNYLLWLDGSIFLAPETRAFLVAELWALRRYDNLLVALVRGDRDTYIPDEFLSLADLTIASA